MNILLVATLKRRVAKDEFASRTRIIYQLGQELAKRGHTVRMLSSADSSIPGVTTVPVVERPWVNARQVENEFQRDVAELLLLSKAILKEQQWADVIHNHTYPDLFTSVIEDQLTKPLVTTLHVVHDFYVDDIISAFPKTTYVALSEAYKQKIKDNTNVQVVHNGIDTSLYTFQKVKKDYLFWLGRLPKSKHTDGTFMDPKGVRWTIELAKKTNSYLAISAPVEDMNFYDRDVKPYLTDKIRFVGEPSSEQSTPVKTIIELFQNAKAFLMTINQEEPFGLVMAEAMSCGTPVIAFNRGAASEIVIDGKTGFLVDPTRGVDGLQEALAKVHTIDPEDCRKHVEDNFSIQRMVSDYEKLYLKLSSGGE